jgi:glycerol-3-phosphate dehydrogenase
MTNQISDLFIIGGGINGCGIARDAAGRGLTVTLAEQGDLAQATSSASSKLFHGGLRYLEYFKFRLVREALSERETLLRAMPHISWPMRFIVPYHGDMRFDTTTPTSKLLTTFMPWMQGRRPAWLIRLGLFLYDNLGGRKILPGTSSLDLTTTPEGAPLQKRFRRAYEYSDCWVDDSRLVVLNARDAQARGAEIMTHTRVTAATRVDGMWRIELETPSGPQTRFARGLVNAAGPWVAKTISDVLAIKSRETIRLVRGSHIVVPKMFDHNKTYFLQGTDGRIIFVFPYQDDFTLIGTTDADHSAPDDKPICSDTERDYLLQFASGYFDQQLTADDVKWSYSGVRPLYDDGASSAASATRDYVLSINTGATDDANGGTEPGAPLLNVFGGKITTYRRLAENAIAKLAPHLDIEQPNWTAGVPMPGGDFPVDGVHALIESLQRDYPFLDAKWANRLIRAYGTEAIEILGQATSAGDLGVDFGATLTEAEVRWLMTREYATCADDVLWRRSKLGLRLSTEQVQSLDLWINAASHNDDKTTG